MKEPSLPTIKRLFAASGNMCAFPHCHVPIIEESGTVTGKICHIKARQKNGARYDASQTDEERHHFENLILLCARHHDIIDKETDIYDVETLVEMKILHESKTTREDVPEDTIFARILLNDLRKIEIVNNTGNIMVDSPGAIQASRVTIQTKKGKLNLLPPKGSIGENIPTKAYIKHLIDRYNQFASSDSTRKTAFKYGAIYKNIIDKFGAKWDMLPLGRAEELMEYLQYRIKRTRQARINKGKGFKSYSSFTEFTATHFEKDKG